MGHRCHAWIADILKNVIKIGILSQKIIGNPTNIVAILYILKV